MGFKKGVIPWNKGKHHTIESNEKNRLSHLGKPGYWTGKKLSTEHRKKLSLAKIGQTGELSNGWRGGGRKDQKRNDSAYQTWVKKVKKRDNNECVFKNKECSGYNIVHHILPWSEYEEERYNIKNGITLCQYHHPKKRIEEKRFIPIFQELVINQMQQIGLQ